MKTWKPLLLATVAMSATACNRPTTPRTQVTTNQSVAATSSQANGIQVTPPSTGDASFKPKRGFVPDEQTAIAIAVAVWNPIYGKEHIEGEKPFHATLKDGVWTVTGSLPEGYDGGTALANIAQDDGRILRVIHYQ